MTITRLTLGLCAATAVALLTASTGAATPNHQACLGHDISSYAQGGRAFGALVSRSLATGGVGPEIQAHLAGEVPDEVIPNSCND